MANSTAFYFCEARVSPIDLLTWHGQKVYRNNSYHKGNLLFPLDWPAIILTIKLELKLTFTPKWIGKMSSLVESKFTLYAEIVKVRSALKFEIEKNHFVPKYVEPKFRFRTWNWTFRETDRALRLEREKEAQGLMTMFTKTIKMSNCEWALNGLPVPHLFLNLLANVH